MFTHVPTVFGAVPTTGALAPPAELHAARSAIARERRTRSDICRPFSGGLARRFRRLGEGALRAQDASPGPQRVPDAHVKGDGHDGLVRRDGRLDEADALEGLARAAQAGDSPERGRIGPAQCVHGSGVEPAAVDPVAYRMGARLATQLLGDVNAVPAVLDAAPHPGVVRSD